MSGAASAAAASAADPPPTTKAAGSVKAIDRGSVHRICSGQVVLTLAIAVKELVENSLDAGATQIDIRLKNSGLDLIEVSDNGSGVSAEDYQALTLKHHTSKLQAFTDLESVETFGFRGEALSSLCALSEVSIVTCTAEQAGVGTSLTYDSNGKLVDQSPHPRETGTTVSLGRLFSKMPVRYSEFKRNIKREFARLVVLLQAYCMVCTEVRFMCTNQPPKGSTQKVLASSPGKSVRDQINNIFGAKMVKTLLPLEIGLGVKEPAASAAQEQQDSAEETAGDDEDPDPDATLAAMGVRISGFVSTTEHGRGRNSNDRQFFSINRRPCEFNKLSKAINEVYHQFNRHQVPCVVLDITMPRNNVDVNVTPDKRKILMQSEARLIGAVRAALRRLWEPESSTYALAKAPVSFSQSLDSFVRKTAPAAAAAKAAKAADEEEEDVLPTAKRARLLDSAAVPVAAEDADELVSTQAEERDEDEGEEGEELLQQQQEEEGEEEGAVDAEVEMEDTAEVVMVADDTTSAMAEETAEEAEAEGTAPSAVSASTGTAKKVFMCQVRGCVKYRIDVGSEMNLATHYKQRHKRRAVPPPEVVRVAPVPSTAAARRPVVGEAIMRLSGDEDEGEEEDQEQDNSRAEAEAQVDQRDAGKEGMVVTDEELPTVVTDGDAEAVEAVSAADLARFEAVPRSVRFKLDLDKLLSDVRQGGGTGQGAAIDEKNAGAGAGRFTATISKEGNATAEAELKRTITKDDFLQMEILGQFNLGFIVTRLRDDLFIIDQHATDEKYNYERLQRDTVMRSQRLIAPKRLELTAVSENILMDNIEVFRKNGFDFDIDEEAEPTRRIKLTSIPCSKATEFGPSDIEELIFMLGSGPGMYRPSRVSAMFASRACRTSIMVGTALDKRQMRTLVRHMSEIEQPWNCPHGRPTMRHLFDLRRIRGGGTTAGSAAEK